MTTIAFDSSTSVCSAALLRDGTVLSERINLNGNNHAALLPKYVQELQSEADRLGLTVEGIVLSEGPGSYTGLRISTSLAKGLCYGAELPLIVVPTLAVLAYGACSAGQIADAGALVCPMIDARRMEVYCTLYDTDMHPLRPVAPVIVDEHSFDEVLDGHVVYFCGNGSDKCRKVISHPNARFADNAVPTGALAGRLAAAYAGRADLVRIITGTDRAYFEPNYLKEFVAAPSHVKGLK